mmetsp:Transcript_13148/g.22246  ORF Transcript_13148/g.22246 Transcript_13148/m.22246 type:complete len:273 (-) Transcript_13148:259-1077(-)
MYIFELDPHLKMSHFQLYRVSLILLFLLFLFYTLHLMQIKMENVFRFKTPWFMLALTLIILLYCFQPFLRCGYRSARYQLGITLYNIAISPFGRVRFRDFFFADIITSMGQTLKDLGTSGYFFLTKDFRIDKAPSGKNPVLKRYQLVVALLPFWFRLFQCLHKYYHTGMRVHLFNAGKYTSKIVPVLIASDVLFNPGNNKVNGAHFPAFLFFNTLATLYCLVWDYYMDWGFFRSTDPRKPLLRNETKFSNRFYYSAMVINCLLRFWWVIGLF